MAEEQKRVADRKVAVAAKKVEVISDEDFITKSPLFVCINVNGFEPPKRISFDCDSVDVVRERRGSEFMTLYHSVGKRQLEPMKLWTGI
jgi:hypothetical protein